MQVEQSWQPWIAISSFMQNAIQNLKNQYVRRIKLKNEKMLEESFKRFLIFFPIASKILIFSSLWNFPIQDRVPLLFLTASNFLMFSGLLMGDTLIKWQPRIGERNQRPNGRRRFRNYDPGPARGVCEGALPDFSGWVLRFGGPELPGIIGALAPDSGASNSPGQSV